jgi:hypothetical protein
MGYQLEGRLLEVCNCKVLCPCWIGEDPDYGTCEGVAAWHIEQGTIGGVDVSGRTVAGIVHIPGNILQGGWRAVLVVDDGTTPAQEQVLVDAWTGKHGGPLADQAQLIGEVVAIERLPITFTVQEGKGTLRVGTLVDAGMTPYLGPTGQVTTLNESMFSTIPGSPAYVAKATAFQMHGTPYGLADVNLQNHNAIQGFFRFEA